MAGVEPTPPKSKSGILPLNYIPISGGVAQSRTELMATAIYSRRPDRQGVYPPLFNHPDSGTTRDHIANKGGNPICLFTFTKSIFILFHDPVFVLDV